MAFPSGAQTITLTGTFPVPVGGTARAGRIALTPSATLVDSTQKAIYSGGGTITLDNAGHFTVVLLCNDDPDIQPTGWRWRVDEQPSGGPRRTYWIDLPHTLGPTVDLSTLAAVDAPDGSGSSSQTATPTGPAGGALTGTYPNPGLSGATIAAFDPAGAASTAQSAAATDATAKVAAHTAASDPHGDRTAASTALAAHAVDSTNVHGIADTTVLETSAGAQSKADSAQAAATSAAATDATGKVTAHTAATDPHGDRAAATSALAAHSADTTDIHGIPDTAALETTSGAQSKADAAQTAAASDATSKVAAHAGATDPHGDRAYTDTQVGTRVPNTRQITAGTGLTGGGTLAADRTLAVTYGTTAGTAAQGNDSRLADPRTPTGPAGGDLSGTFPDPAVAKVNGVAVTGTPSAGQVPTATSGTAASWQTPTVPPSPASSVTSETSYGQSSAAGTASVYARGDHTHGTPALPTPASIGALAASGDQTFTGELSFVDRIPVLPAFDAAFANQAVRLAQMQAAIAAAGGGSQIRTAKARITDDNLSGLPAAASWAIVQTSAGTKLQCSIAASVGDRIEVLSRFMRKGGHFLDWVLLDNTGAIAVYAASETGSPLGEGDPALYPSLSFSYETGPPMFTVGSGHIASGLVTVALAHQGGSTGNANIVYAHSTYPWTLRLRNIGPEPA